MAKTKDFTAFPKEKQIEILQAKLVDYYRTRPQDPQRQSVLEQLKALDPKTLENEKLATRCLNHLHRSYQSDPRITILTALSDGFKVDPELIGSYAQSSFETREDQMYTAALLKHVEPQTLLLSGGALEAGKITAEQLSLFFPKLDLATPLTHCKSSGFTLGKAIGAYPKSQHLGVPFKELTLAYYEHDIAEELIGEMLESKEANRKTQPWHNEVIDSHGGWYNPEKKAFYAAESFAHVSTLMKSGLVSPELQATFTRYDTEFSKQFEKENADWVALNIGAEYHYIEAWQSSAGYSIDTRLKALAFNEGWVRIGISQNTVEAEGKGSSLTASKSALDELAAAHAARYNMPTDVKVVAQDKLVAVVQRVVAGEMTQKALEDAIRDPEDLERKIQKDLGRYDKYSGTYDR